METSKQTTKTLRRKFLQEKELSGFKKNLGLTGFEFFIIGCQDSYRPSSYEIYITHEDVQKFAYNNRYISFSALSNSTRLKRISSILSRLRSKKAKIILVFNTTSYSGDTSYSHHYETFDSFDGLKEYLLIRRISGV